MQIHFYIEFRIIMLNIAILGICYWSASEAWYKVYRILHICVYTCIYDMLSITDWTVTCHSYLWCQYDLVTIHPLATKHILTILEEIGQHRAWY